LPEIAAACVRISAITDATNAFTPSSWPVSSSSRASVGAVIAGCLVASVKCRKCISMKLAA
jgi:hypothetical protein